MYVGPPIYIYIYEWCIDEIIVEKSWSFYFVFIYKNFLSAYKYFPIDQKSHGLYVHVYMYMYIHVYVHLKKGDPSKGVDEAVVEKVLVFSFVFIP